MRGQMFNQLVHAAADLLLLRGGPQNLPTSYPLVIALGVAYVAVNTLVFRAQGVPDVNAVLQSATVLAVMVAYLQVLLNWRKFRNRLPQTLTAQLIIGLLFSVLAYLPIAKIAPLLPDMQAGKVDAPAPAVFVLMALAIWSLAVNAYILKVSLEIRMLLAVAFTIFFEILSLAVVGLLFGAGIPA
jgi:undecaprenyl pyrophosphate phosphatase UppP